ncbi:hypothetical protein A3C59_02525 [Candidatus Daviesbacteria bacterium RIFCSPHIGHO2_02_FULL_36_13]|uniref:Uncharacterized protein n=1 Tax=Candidatus Daviesbacteria bacterium RIFCSPHIGHO2_02_FULL_36_13 TaxID=1797768 RepID=A0A1F5JNE9_9BACT|nr:MAG: hypothetical protein A3C59_02525 [Candidatus Daviesbacteria bacterium RIFCSPHIGHO2_02_FULL_36_13]
MIRFLPFILVIFLVLGGLGYWRFFASKPSLPSPGSDYSTDQIQFPVTGADATLEEKVEILEEIAKKLVAQKATTTDLDSINTSIAELKTKVSALETASPTTTTTTSTQTSTSKSSVYIPLGSGGGPWGNQDWYSTPEYQIALDPANYPGYSGMVLEVTFRLAESAGTGSVRLYNTTDSSATSSQLDTTSSEFVLKNSASFKLPTGSKTYKLQIKSTDGKNLFIQSARIKVNF